MIRVIIKILNINKKIFLAIIGWIQLVQMLVIIGWIQQTLVEGAKKVIN